MPVGEPGGGGEGRGRFRLDRRQSAHPESWAGQDQHGNDPDFAGGKYARGAENAERGLAGAFQRAAHVGDDGSLAPSRPGRSAMMMAEDEMSTHTPSGANGAVMHANGRLQQVDRTDPARLNVRAWTSSDALVLKDVPSVLCVGFDSGVDFGLITNVKAAAVALEIVSASEYLGAQVVFWDGAPLRHDSFTSVLPALAARGCRLAAWRAEGASRRQKDELCASWSGVDAAEAVVALFDEKSPRAGTSCDGASPRPPRGVSPTAANNLKLLHYANVKHVLCFGGGKDVLDMVEHAPSDVSFHVVPAVRCADNGADGVFGTDDDLFEEAHVLAYGGRNADRVHVYKLHE